MIKKFKTYSYLRFCGCGIREAFSTAFRVQGSKR